MFQKILKMPFWKFIVLIGFSVFLLGVGIQVYIFSHFIKKGYQLVRVFEEEAKEDTKERKQAKESEERMNSLSNERWKKFEEDRKISEAKWEKEKIEMAREEKFLQKQEKLRQEQQAFELKQAKARDQAETCPQYKRLKKRQINHTGNPIEDYTLQKIKESADRGWFDIKACINDKRKRS